MPQPFKRFSLKLLRGSFKIFINFIRSFISSLIILLGVNNISNGIYGYLLYTCRKSIDWINVTCNVRLIKIANGVAISDESRLLVEDYSYTVYDPFRSGHTVKCVETTILRKP